MNEGGVSQQVIQKNPITYFFLNVHSAMFS